MDENYKRINECLDKVSRDIEVIQKNGTLFYIKMQKIEVKKTKKSRSHYEADFRDWASPKQYL